MPWLTSVRSSADSGTCTSSTAMPSTTGYPTSTGMVSPQGQSRAGAQRQCPRLRTGCSYQQSPWGPSPRIFKHTVGMGARADRVPILERSYSLEGKAVRASGICANISLALLGKALPKSNSLGPKSPRQTHQGGCSHLSPFTFCPRPRVVL